MPSWGIHLVTANDVLKQINIKDKNSFIIGNFLPDAERYVVKDFSISVPYDISHFAQRTKINGIEEKLPDYEAFIDKYKKDLKKPIILGYLTHLITDYYWNNLTFSKYTVGNEKGEVIGVLINEKEYLSGDREFRRILKQDDFTNFDTEVLQTKDYKMPIMMESCMNELKILEETKYISSDIIKIIDYLERMVKIKKEEELKEYKLFTKEEINKYYLESIKFIANILKEVS